MERLDIQKCEDGASPPLHRLPHPRDNLLQYRRRRREIQPREPRVIRAKGLAKIQPNLGLIQKELPGRARQFQPPAIEPGRDMSPPVPASSRPEARRRASPPANRGSPATARESHPSSRLPFIPRRHRGIDPGDPRRAEQPRRDALLKPLLQSGRAKMHDGAAQSRDVETLGRRGDGDGARRDLRMQRCEWNMRVAGTDDVRVDLVGHHHQIMPDQEVRNLLQFYPGEGAPGRVCGWQNISMRRRG